ncbi:caspase domain-containing protein [Armillaria luteobubalina]|uniref:Caspase domain-containing protein n=1 Tax=Armillaria luteobubalina TaxID=153913 RepID=A0AA39UKJ9_9AGAR|nr:caspase domain-containing protein [Armillaria luteobubalina]
MHTLYHRRKELVHLQVFGHTESESLPSAPKPPPGIDPSRFWAVLIGIDDYPTSPLRGCVSDAKDIAEYLLEDLGMAEDRVQRLLSGDNACIAPTRENIINALLGLSTNPWIQAGDSIVIYFSGHGSTYQCADYLPYNGSYAGVGTIEALCPVDRGGYTSDGDVPDISDREINGILSEISRTKGHHITVILDCCHSSSLTRAPQGERTVRSIRPMSKASSVAVMLQAADNRLRYLPGYQSVLEEDWFPDMESHVILAACKEYEYATEIKGVDGYHGIFTRGLIKALKSVTNDTSYFDLLEALPSTINQTPTINGKHRNANLWYQASVSRDSTSGIR